MTRASNFGLLTPTSSRRIALGQKLGAGGAGTVFEVHGDHSTVVKIYHDTISPKDLANYSRQLKAMVMEPPDLPPFRHEGRSYVQIAWPTALLMRDGKFAGFSMPALELSRTKTLEYLLNDKQAAKAGLRSDMGTRVTMARQLAGVVAALHAKGHYVVDMKPLNLSYYPDALYMAVLDCDGFNIHDESSGDHYPAPMFTLEYLAPEFQVTGGNPNSDPKAQDKFALAVIIFQLLCHGVHPYSGVLRGQSNLEVPARILKGYFPHGRTPNPNCDPNPSCTHWFLPDELLECFDRAFGNDPARRPSAQEWATRLEKYANPSTRNLITCKVDPKHRHFAGLPCSKCNRENRTIQRVAPSRHAQSPSAGPVRVSTPASMAHASASTSVPPLVATPPPISQAPQQKPRTRWESDSLGAVLVIGIFVALGGWNFWKQSQSTSVAPAGSSANTANSGAVNQLCVGIDAQVGGIVEVDNTRSRVEKILGKSFLCLDRTLPILARVVEQPPTGSKQEDGDGGEKRSLPSSHRDKSPSVPGTDKPTDATIQLCVGSDAQIGDMVRGGNIRGRVKEIVGESSACVDSAGTALPILARVVEEDGGGKPSLSSSHKDKSPPVAGAGKSPPVAGAGRSPSVAAAPVAGADKPTGAIVQMCVGTDVQVGDVIEGDNVRGRVKEIVGESSVCVDSAGSALPIHARVVEENGGGKPSLSSSHKDKSPPVAGAGRSPSVAAAPVARADKPTGAIVQMCVGTDVQVGDVIEGDNVRGRVKEIVGESSVCVDSAGSALPIHARVVEENGGGKPSLSSSHKDKSPPVAGAGRSPSVAAAPVARADKPTGAIVQMCVGTDVQVGDVIEGDNVRGRVKEIVGESSVCVDSAGSALPIHARVEQRPTAVKQEDGSGREKRSLASSHEEKTLHSQLNASGLNSSGPQDGFDTLSGKETPSVESTPQVVRRAEPSRDRENLKTCISGEYPSLCKHSLLTREEAVQVEAAEKHANFGTCNSGEYPSLCKHSLLTREEAVQVEAAEKHANFGTCNSGEYPSLCKHSLLTSEEAIQVQKAELRANFRTCISGHYPSLCRHSLLTQDEAVSVAEAERRALGQ